MCCFAVTCFILLLSQVVVLRWWAWPTWRAVSTSPSIVNRFGDWLSAAEQMACCSLLLWTILSNLPGEPCWGEQPVPEECCYVQENGLDFVLSLEMSSSACYSAYQKMLPRYHQVCIFFLHLGTNRGKDLFMLLDLLGGGVRELLVCDIFPVENSVEKK